MLLALLALPLLQLGCTALRGGVSFEVGPRVSATLKQTQDERFTLQSGVQVLQLSGECNSDFGMNALVADFNFDWSLDDMKAAPVTGEGDGRPTLVSALQEKLGLKLESRRVPAEYVVIDHAELPSEN